MQNENELYHHGVLGQKWGVRRYQNSDGTLTSSGKRKAASMRRKYTKYANDNPDKTYGKKASNMRIKYEELTGTHLTKYPNASVSKTKYTEKTSSKKSSTKPKTKSISEMSDDELNAAIARKKLENSYRELHPQQVSSGKSFVKNAGSKVLTSVVLPAAEDIGKQLVKSYMAKGVNKLLDLEGESKVYANNQKKK